MTPNSACPTSRVIFPQSGYNGLRESIVAPRAVIGYQAGRRNSRDLSRRPSVQRREFLVGAAGLLGATLAPRLAFANVPTPFTFDMAPPMDSREKFIEWGVAQRGEDPKYLGERFDRFGALVRNKDVWDDRNKRAFLLTPREEFVLHAEPAARLRPRLPRHRLRRHHLRPAYRRPHDHLDRRQEGREGARDRHRLGLPVGLSRRTSPTRSGRSRSSSRWPSARAAPTTR